jgi:hypothetical protein
MKPIVVGDGLGMGRARWAKVAGGFGMAGVVLTAGFMPAVALAHIPQSDGSMHAELHIEPSDEAVVGQPSMLSFEFKDERGAFRLADCNCDLAVLQNGRVLYTHVLPLRAVDGAGVPYIFSKAGDYNVRLTGVPKAGGSFKPFSMMFDVTAVSTGGGQPSHDGAHGSVHEMFYIALIGAGALFVGFYNFFQIRRRGKDVRAGLKRRK